MTFSAKVVTESGSIPALEAWGASLDLASSALAIENATKDGTLQHLRVSNENFADSIARKSGISRFTIDNVFKHVDSFYIDNQFVDAGQAKLSTESLFGNPEIVKHFKFADLKDISCDAVQDLVETCMEGFSPAKITSTCKEIASILSNRKPVDTITEELREALPNSISTYDAVGARAYGHFANPNIGTESLNQALESFGATINQLNVNTRLAIAVTILRNFSSTIDKLFVRVTDDSNTVLMTIPNPVVFSLEMANNAKSSVRNNPETEVALVNVHAEPGIVNTAPQEVMPNINLANEGYDGETHLDTQSVPGSIALLANGSDANLFDLCANANRFGYESVNHTDTIAEGGDVKYVIIRATKTAADGKSAPIVENYTASVGGLPSSRYITTANNSDSGDTIVSLQDLPVTITSTSTTNGGTQTAIFKDLGRANVSLRVNFTSSLRLKYADINGSGGVVAKAVAAAGVSDASAATDIANAANVLSGVTFEVFSFIPKLFFNEENVRKTTIAVRVNWLQRAFQIPQGRNFTSDSALDQEKEIAAIEAVQTAMSIGNSDRGMAVCESRADEIADIIEGAHENPEIYRRNRIQNLSYAATICRPYVLRATADYKQLNVSVMRESERLSDKHAKVVQILLNALTNVTTRSLYNTSIQPGERVVFKALMHQVPADLLFNISSYHATLQDAVTKANGADYSFVLPNGYRIDVVKTNFTSWQNSILVMPVKEDDPASILSFATIRDRGVFAGTIPGGPMNGAVSIREVLNSREFVLVTNPIGLKLTVDNIDIDLGSIDVIDAL